MTLFNHRPKFDVWVAAYVLILLLSGCKSPEEDHRESGTAPPNIVIFLADDLGYGDLNSYGGVAATPNIDRLARNGLRFSDFYAPAPNCSPSRAGLLTGRNPNRVGIYSYRSPGSSMHLKEEEITIAELLKGQGYETALFGKWHLSSLQSGEGEEKQPTPGDQGFDYWLATENNAAPSHRNPVNFVRNGVPEDRLKGYSSHILAREANHWLGEEGREQPFFLYIPFHEVHKKIASPDTLINKYRGQNNPEYLANVENMDAAVGKVIDKLKKLGEFENTLILFSSDNGSYRPGSNGRLRGYKGESFEGGVRVPAIMHWPDKIKKARKISAPAGLIDLFATLASLTGGEIPGDRTIDGESLLPLIEEKQFKRSRPLLWYFYRAHPELGMRSGKYVLNAFTGDSLPRTHYFSDKDMSFIRKARLKEFSLYNIEKDPLQKRDIASQNPGVLDSLKAEARKIFREISSEGPFWKNLPDYNRERARKKWLYMRNREVRWDMDP